MKFHLESAQIFVPDGLTVGTALARTTHMAISAHQDDIEIMATGPLLECFQQEERWFTGVVVTDGRGSPRSGLYKRYSDEEMRKVRFKEQCKAAVVGEYAAQVMLDYPSKSVKNGADQRPVEDLAQLLQAARPQFVYTHNLADKHDTHIAVALKTITAIRSLPQAERPQKLYGCEVWRDLDWMLDQDKISFNLTSHENLQAALLGVYDSQIAGGKRYDLASLARRRANATYSETHVVDQATGLSYAMDLTPLIEDMEKEVIPHVESYIQRFLQDVARRIQRLSQPE
jgi:LmbE family N-acetylglucosaminyl deacetylase